MRYKITEEQLKSAVQESLSLAQVCRLLNIRAAGGNYQTLKTKLKLFNIDTQHFTGQGWNTGIHYKKCYKGRSLEEILIEKSTYTNSSLLKERLYKAGLKTKICEKCKLENWDNKPITLELDHINGNSMDNRIENLRILCPNCHSQTTTYRRRKKTASERQEAKLINFINK